MNRLWAAGQTEQADRCMQENRELSHRFGLTNALRWQDAEEVYGAIVRGRLRQVEELSTRVLDRLTGSNQYQEAGNRACRAIARAARGDTGGALADSEIAFTQVLRIRDSQVLGMRADRAVVLLLTNHLPEALAMLEEFVGAPETFDAWTFAPLVAAELGRPDLITAMFERTAAENPWRVAASALAAGNPADAAETYAAIGAALFEGWARLLAAEQGDLSQLERARAYFAQEGATLFLGRCDALLPASA
jgi:hypothetical protein